MHDVIFGLEVAEVLVGVSVVFFVDVLLVDVAGEVVIYVECLLFLEIAPCQTYTRACVALVEICVFIYRGTIVCQDVYLRLCSVVEGAPKEFVGHLLRHTAYGLCHCLSDTQIHSQVIDVPYDDILSVSRSKVVAFLQHGTDIGTLIPI